MSARTEEEILSGLLLVSIGGHQRELPVRPIVSARAWKRTLVGSLAVGIGSMELANIVDGGNVAAAFGDKVLGLVAEYDESGALGGREWLEANATDEQVYGLFIRLLHVTFPFVTDLRSALAELSALGIGDLLATSVGQPTEKSISDSAPSLEPEVPPASSAS